jgi:hypothetical protein
MSCLTVTIHLVCYSNANPRARLHQVPRDLFPGTTWPLSSGLADEVTLRNRRSGRHHGRCPWQSADPGHRARPFTDI